MLRVLPERDAVPGRTSSLFPASCYVCGASRRCQYIYLDQPYIFLNTRATSLVHPPRNLSNRPSIPTIFSSLFVWTRRNATGLICWCWWSQSSVSVRVLVIEHNVRNARQTQQKSYDQPLRPYPNVRAGYPVVPLWPQEGLFSVQDRCYVPCAWSDLREDCEAVTHRHAWSESSCLEVQTHREVEYVTGTNPRNIV